MGIAFRTAIEHTIPDICQYFEIDIFFDDPIGINDDKSWSYICKDIIISVSSYKITQYFRLIEDVHIAHIWIQFSLRDLIRIVDICDNVEFAIWSFRLVLNLILL